MDHSRLHWAEASASRPELLYGAQGDNCRFDGQAAKAAGKGAASSLSPEPSGSERSPGSAWIP
eukprot:12896975-Prorocentrum_lima.AAC.1